MPVRRVRSMTSDHLDRPLLLRLLPILSLLALLAAACVLSYLAHHITRRGETEKFESEFGSAGKLLSDRFVTDFQTLTALVSVLAHTYEEHNLTASELYHLVSPLLDMATFRGVSYNPVVLDADRAAFDAALRNEQDFGPGLPPGQPPGMVDFGIWAYASNGTKAPSVQAAYYVPVLYIFPLAANHLAVGFNINSNPIRRHAIDLAAATSKPAATDIIQLVQDADSKAASLILSPIRKNITASTGTIEALSGFVVAVLNFDHLLENVIPRSIRHVDAVLTSNLGSSYTFRIDRGNVISQKPGALFDRSYGKYRVSRSTVVGTEWTLDVYPTEMTESANHTSNPSRAVGVVITAMVIISLIFLSYYFLARRYRHQLRNLLHSSSRPKREWHAEHRAIGHDSSGDSCEPTELEVRTLRLIEQIGSGEFSIVFKAMLAEDATHTTTVAAKTLPQESSVGRHMLLREAAAMSLFDHPNIIKLLGVITTTRAPFLVTSYCEHGNLKDFLQRYRLSFTTISLHKRLVILSQIISGLEYLHEHMFVHRDVAARNVLVTSDYTFVLSDFGIAHRLDNDGTVVENLATSELKMPVRWTAPEALTKGRFSSASDIYSFGVFGWEVLTDAELPFADVPDHLVVDRICHGECLERTTTMSDDVYFFILLPCWAKNPHIRPTASVLKDFIGRSMESPGPSQSASPVPDQSAPLLRPDAGLGRNLLRGQQVSWFVADAVDEPAVAAFASLGQSHAASRRSSAERETVQLPTPPAHLSSSSRTSRTCSVHSFALGQAAKNSSAAMGPEHAVNSSSPFSLSPHHSCALSETGSDIDLQQQATSSAGYASGAMLRSLSPRISQQGLDLPGANSNHLANTAPDIVIAIDEHEVRNHPGAPQSEFGNVASNSPPTSRSSGYSSVSMRHESVV
eukprot:m.302101 g.302101  ORF g.302101 m.302101 type:complete len:913 (-) comp15031_c0_seq1:224-2962(-)